MSFEWFVSLRYLRARRKQTFISIITFISIAGVMVGVTALIVVLAVMTGFGEDLKSKILGLNAHAIVQKHGENISNPEAVQKRIEKLDGVLGTTPFVYSEAMISSLNGASGIILRGIDTRSSRKVIDLDKCIVKGSLEELERGSAEGSGSGSIPPGLIVGKELARSLGLFQGDIVQILTPAALNTPLGVMPSVKRFRVVGVFESGMFEYDFKWAFISLKSAQEVLGLGRDVTGIEVKVADVYKADQVATAIDKDLGFPYRTRDWMQLNRTLFSALKLEKVVMFVILALIVLVAAFNIASTLIMVVMEKNRDIAILKSMGATRKSIMKIFVLEGVIVGLAGTVLGIIGALFLTGLLKRYEFIKLPSDVYYISTLPVRVETLDVVLVSLAAVLISFLATLYPSWQASKLEPASALRYE